MTVNVLHLYHDLMNLYGESGNIKALVSAVGSQGVEITVDRLSLSDKIDFDKYDMIYLGSSTRDNLSLALSDLKSRRDGINDYIKNGKLILATGNSFELFGKKIDDAEALGIFNYSAKKTDKRIVGDYIEDTEYGKIIAFQNRGSEITDNDIPFIREDIGVNDKGFYGTYLIGPVLVRNPFLNVFFAEKLIKGKQADFKFEWPSFELENKARDQYLKNYYEK